MKSNVFLLIFTSVFIMSCASVSLEADSHISKSRIEKIPFNATLQDLEKNIGKPTDVVEHPNGAAVYYDGPQMGHYRFPIAKFAFNKKNQLIGKTWYCDQSCKSETWTKFKERYPAANFVMSAAKKGSRLNYGPDERFYTDVARNMMVEVDGNSITVIHWDAPGSTPLNR